MSAVRRPGEGEAADGGPQAVPPSLDQRVEAARRLEGEGDFEAALGAWQQVRELFGGRAEGFVSGAGLLRRMGRAQEAVRVLEEALRRFPSLESVRVAHAWSLFDTGDFESARSSWRDVRQSFPSNPDGYLGGALACRRLGAFDEADEIYLQGLRRFPANSRLLDEYGWCAHDRGDIVQVRRRWEMLRHRFPDLAIGFLRTGVLELHAGHLEKAERILCEGVQRFSGDAEMAQSFAWVAHARGEWLEALKRWERVINRFPQFAVGRWGAAQALFELGRTMEAGAVLGPALRMFPDDVRVAVLNARLASSRGEPAEAEKVWKDLRSRFPDSEEMYSGHANCLRELGRETEAFALLREGAARLPGSSMIAMDLARIPQDRQEWSFALEAWREAQGRFPNEPAVSVGLGRCLFEAGKSAEAREVLEQARARFADDLGAAVAEAELCRRLKDFPRALELWGGVRQRFPGNPAGFTGTAHTLRDAGRFEQAAQIIEDALERFPDHLELQMQLALTLGSTGQWPKAVAIWESLRLRYPNRHLLMRRAHQIREEARRDQPELFKDAQAASFAEPEAAEPTDTLASVFKRFQSLGVDCEFGLVQRIFGADAPSLLRWSNIYPENLVRLLDSRLEGVGEPRFTTIRLAMPENEFVTEDARFAMLGHTFTAPTTITMESFYAEQCRRMQWLKGKLLHDLAAGRKIFVYKLPELAEEQALAIYEALRRHCGHVALLAVRRSDDAHPAGTVERRAGNLFVAWLEHFSLVDVSVTGWVGICRKVLEQADAAAAQGKGGGE